MIDGAVVVAANLADEPETMPRIEMDVLQGVRSQQTLDLICQSCDLPRHKLIRAHHNAILALARSARGRSTR
jgi:hypothetical protein